MSDDPIAVTIRDAASKLGMSVGAFRKHVLPHLEVVQPTDRLVRVPVSELEKWVEKNAARG